jgi:hypothetical protein
MMATHTEDLAASSAPSHFSCTPAVHACCIVVVLQEYNAMLYGRDAPLVNGDQTPHFQLASDGMMFGTGSDVLYTLTGCMAESLTDCQTQSSSYYR